MSDLLGGINMVKFMMYGIYNEDDDYWFNVELDGWVELDEIDGECLFPSFELAQDYIDDVVRDPSAKVYKIELPIAGMGFQFYPDNLK
jgi:hypothetical protein